MNSNLVTVARATIGEGKLLGSRGPEKLDELDRLYAAEPAAFALYCLRDAELASRVLFSTGLMDLSLARASLTGTRLEAAWTSIAAFERVYDTESMMRGIVAPDRGSGAPVSGASGGQVLSPVAGFHRNVLVFDFRSLYPSLMRSFGLDPLAYELGMRATEFFPPGAVSTRDCVLAPNGARFRKASGILPSLIARYTGEREAAQASGDETASYVYKILMNSFYGVLGAGGCKYARTELAGAVTSFGRLFLNRARGYFESSGFTVLYGDTDSVFVSAGNALPEFERTSPSKRFAAYSRLGNSLASALNDILRDEIQRDYGLPSFLLIRYEKAYTRFFLPRLRLSLSSEAGAEDLVRGRAKGYAGYLLDAIGDAHVEVKGMEAVRSDVTELARSFQLGILELVFRDAGAEAVDAFVKDTIAALKSGSRDGDLVYRKRLGRPAQSYVDIEPPQVKVARQLGWTARRGRVEYVMTTNGPQALSLLDAPIDYGHYIEKQVKPIALSVADVLGWDLSRHFGGDTQLSLEF